MASALAILSKRSTGPTVRVRTHDIRIARVDITFSGTYTTGGEACDFTALDGNLIPAANIIMVEIGCGALPLFFFNWDSVNKKVVAFSVATGLQLANGNAGLAGNVAQALIFLRG
jgi:hypothetical protein